MTDLFCCVSFFLEAERFFLVFLKKKKEIDSPQKKKERENKEVVCDILEIMLFVCYTSS